MFKIVLLKFDEKEFMLFVMIGFEGEYVVDIGKFCVEIGYIIFDDGFGNIGFCISVIMFIDGEVGILCYCGYLIE